MLAHLVAGRGKLGARLRLPLVLLPLQLMRERRRELLSLETLLHFRCKHRWELLLLRLLLLVLR